jgi:predicted nucleotidyltransferase component of viral defense system
MSGTNYKQLYSLQTKVLQLFNAIDGPFYLTGGTALCRFYLNHRFSADLDFFVNNLPDFRKAIEPYENLIHTNFSLQKEGSLITDEFVRYLIVQDNISLKIEFVNDVLYRYKIPIPNAIYPVDNVRNILSNKLTCIVGRDEPKDFFDIITLSLQYQFNWLEIFNEATEKALINEIDISQRVAEFPVEWLLQVDWLMTPPDIDRIKSLQEIISKDILLGSDNSLCSKGITLDNAVINFNQI